MIFRLQGAHTPQHPPQEPIPPPQVPLVYVSEPLVWEYKQRLFDLEEEEAPHDEALNELGQEGWELAAVTKHAGRLIYTFKRLAT
jgi:hypothetical protein